MGQDNISETQNTTPELSPSEEKLVLRVRELEDLLTINAHQLEKAITDHKRIEEIIERGKRQWEATFDAVTDLIILTAGQGRIIRCNLAATRSLKLSYQDLIGSYINDVFFGNTPGEGCTYDPLTFEGDSLDLQFPCLSGWFNVSNYPLVQEGIALGVVHIIKDITENRKAEEALRESREELRQTNDALEHRVKERTQELSKANQDLKHEVQEREKIQALQAKEKELLAITLLSIRDGVISTDRDGIVLLYNNAAQNITGFSQAEVLGKNVNDVMQILDENSSLKTPDSMSLLLGTPLENEQNPNSTHIFTLLNKEGKKLLISTSSAPVRDTVGNLVGYVIVFDNITEQRRMQEQLGLSQKLESIGQLAAGIAHEINTPMQYVGDNTHFMSDAFNSMIKLHGLYEEVLPVLAQSGQYSDVLEKINQEKQSLDIDYFISEVPTAINQSLDGIDRIRKIVLAMKAFSHPSNKEKHAANINQGIETTVIISRNEWKYVADLETDLDANLPLVLCEIDEINQVILNMIINASHAIQEHAAKGGPKPGKIMIQTRHDGEHALISIKDSGYGIQPANLSRIFDPFFTTKEVGKGTGQGLSLAHNIIVNEHKGRISVESEVGKGTIFTIQLPIADAEKGDNDDIL
jgi:PAS domain S-box-containing protein